MKHLFALLLASILFLSTLIACAPEANQSQLTPPEATTVEETTPETVTTTPKEVTETPEVVTPPEEITPEESTTLEETTTFEETTTPETEEVKPLGKDASTIVSALNATMTFSSTFGCEEAVLKDMSDKTEVVSAFLAEGFTPIAVDMVEGAKFETVLLANLFEMVTIYWMPKEKELRILWEAYNADAISLLSQNKTTAFDNLIMAQIGVERIDEDEDPDVGMSYVFKLSNGRAIVIDGGWNNAPNAENLFKTLEKLDIYKNCDGKYVIEAWIFSHGHSDHNGIIYAFGDAYADRVDVTYFMYQIPVNSQISATGAGVAGEADFHNTVKKTFPNATYINPHVGLKYYIGNATVEVLFTPDVYWSPETPLSYYNNTSLIFNVTGGGTGFLCMGDAGEISASKSWSLFSPISYKSGILQLTHHGMATGAGGSGKWEVIEKIYNAADVVNAVLPLGVRIGDSLDGGNGRWSVLFANANAKYHVSYITNNDDAPTSTGYVNQKLFNRFIADVENGTTLAAEFGYPGLVSLFGYNGINVLDNGKGLISYISCSDKTEMVTVFSLAYADITVVENDVLDDWFSYESDYQEWFY